MQTPEKAVTEDVAILSAAAELGGGQGDSERQSGSQRQQIEGGGSPGGGALSEKAAPEKEAEILEEREEDRPARKREWYEVSEVVKTIRENPLLSILLFLIIGLLVGLSAFIRFKKYRKDMT